MSTEHPFTPPLELAQKCWDELRNQTQLLDSATGWDKAIALAYQAGADQELEACCEWAVQNGYNTIPPRLCAARRPKPPSLKEQALEALVSVNSNFHVYGSDIDIIRRALEALDA